VHIADVSFFVQEGSYTDEEAERRGNSAYLATHVIPMLPPILTEHLCSLIANVPRFSISVEMNIDKKGGLINYDIQPGIISVSRRLTYEQAQYILDAPQNRMNQEDQKAKPHLEKLNACAQLLTKRRIQNGSLELELPDVAIHYKEDDPAIPDRVEPVNRLDSHRLVEEFMLLANRVVARVLSERGLGIYRIHDAPKAEDLLHFQQVLQQLGIIQTMKRKGKKVNLVSILDEIKGKKESPFIQYLLLRTLTQAFYHPSPSLHFALNFDYYTHFTSPIRRYCDLLVHRLLKRHLHFPIETHSIGPPPHRSKRKGEKLNVRKLRFIAKHISTTERDAEKAEREIVKRKLVYFMKDKIGNTYDGIISGMTDFGFFVAIKPYGIEGLCRLADLPHHYIYDEANYTYYSHQTKQQYKLGDPISIKVVNVDTTRYFIDYMVL
jgi:ribonuclease R